MRAWRVHEFGPYRDRLRWEECPSPVASEGGAIVEVAAAGLNFPDLLTIAGTYQTRPPLPFTPGLEAVGTIVAAGKDSRWQVGQRVIAGVPWGAFAEVVAASDDDLYSCPSEMPDREAAGFLVTYQTSYLALVDRAQLRAGEVLLVHGGAGGVGTAAIQIGNALGATVIATATGARKAEICRRAGAAHVVDLEREDFVARVLEASEGRGANVIYDPVGGDICQRSTKCIAFAGRLLIIGFASGTIPTIAANRVLLKNIAVIGMHWGAYKLHARAAIDAAHERLEELYASGRVAPMISMEAAMSELPAALDHLASRSSYGKVIVRRD